MRGFNPKGTITDERTAGSYNNFYEFSLQKDRAKDLAINFVTSPGELKSRDSSKDRSRSLDLAELINTMPLEERAYRFRDVEAWPMIVP